MVEPRFKPCAVTPSLPIILLPSHHQSRGHFKNCAHPSCLKRHSDRFGQERIYCEASPGNSESQIAGLVLEATDLGDFPAPVFSNAPIPTFLQRMLCLCFTGQLKLSPSLWVRSNHRAIFPCLQWLPKNKINRMDKSLLWAYVEYFKVYLSKDWLLHLYHGNSKCMMTLSFDFEGKNIQQRHKKSQPVTGEIFFAGYGFCFQGQPNLMPSTFGVLSC